MFAHTATSEAIVFNLLELARLRARSNDLAVTLKRFIEFNAGHRKRSIRRLNL